MSDFSVIYAQKRHWLEIGELIKNSTNKWYENHGKSGPFSCSKQEMTIFCEIYEDLDPGCCMLVVDEKQNKIAGSCFVHIRKSHISLGIMNVHPDYYGFGIANRLLNEIVQMAEKADLPLRLISSSMNLESFSLYNKHGFVPQRNYQDMLVKVPAEGIGGLLSVWDMVRPAELSDVEAIYQLEKKLSKIDREMDLKYFIENKLNIWKMLVYVNSQGEIEGYLNAICHPASKMLGPGVMTNESVAMALYLKMLDQYRDETMLALVPCDCPRLIEAMYRLKAKNCELHFTQVKGAAFTQQGISVPTFLPETA